jgi:AraC-like DNA-binding protein
VRRDSLRELVGQMRSVGCAVALRFPAALGRAHRHLVLQAYPLGIRAVVLEGEPVELVLATSLSSPYDLAAEWIGWMRLHHEITSPTADLLTPVIQYAACYPSIGDLCAALDLPQRTLRHRCEKESLPKPERWFQGARLVHAQLELQRDPQLSIARVAALLGYADSASFSNRVSHLFGVTAEVSRGLLGLEWRLHWWRKLAVEQRSGSIRDNAEDPLYRDAEVSLPSLSARDSCVGRLSEVRKVTADR